MVSLRARYLLTHRTEVRVVVNVHDTPDLIELVAVEFGFNVPLLCLLEDLCWIATSRYHFDSGC